MKPSARQIIESVDWSLTARVAPAVEDKWAASTLRSVHCLLLHVAARVEIEGPVLHEDNLDCREALRSAADALAAAGFADAAEAARGAAERRWREADDYPSIPSLAEENEHLRGAVDDAVRVAAAHRPSTDEAFTALDAYVRRRLVRDQPMFMPAFLEVPF